MLVTFVNQFCLKSHSLDKIKFSSINYVPIEIKDLCIKTYGQNNNFFHCFLEALSYYKLIKNTDIELIENCLTYYEFLSLLLVQNTKNTLNKEVFHERFMIYFLSIIEYIINRAVNLSFKKDTILSFGLAIFSILYLSILNNIGLLNYLMNYLSIIMSICLLFLLFLSTYFFFIEKDNQNTAKESIKRFLNLVCLSLPISFLQILGCIIGCLSNNMILIILSCFYKYITSLVIVLYDIIDKKNQSENLKFIIINIIFKLLFILFILTNMIFDGSIITSLIISSIMFTIVMFTIYPKNKAKLKY